jgi:hypothetical protein
MSEQTPIVRDVNGDSIELANKAFDDAIDGLARRLNLRALRGHDPLAADHLKWLRNCDQPTLESVAYLVRCARALPY